MSMERDPLLQKLFDIAKQELPSKAFIAGIMSRINALRRRAIIAWAVTGSLLVLAAWVMAPTVVGAVNLLAQALPQSLVEFDEPASLIGQMLSPRNSIAAVIAITVLIIVFAYRKIF